MKSDKKIRLLALDVDGTLFDDAGRISPASVQAIKEANAAGVSVILATGRDFDALPLDQLTGTDIPYAVTTNGAAVYRTSDRKCLQENCMPVQELQPLLEFLLQQEVYITVFIDGRNNTPVEVYDYVYNLGVPDYILSHFLEDRNPMPDVLGYIREGNPKIQKIVLNFQHLEDGTLLNREKVIQYVRKRPALCMVDGGFFNIELTGQGVSKAAGLRFIADYLGISLKETMAIGDSGNDAEMLKAAGIGVAMGNAPEEIKEIADAVTRSNAGDGVAYAICQWCLV